MAPLVTVFMPVYNAEKYLRGAIESTLNQTLDDFEFLMIDDGSNDCSLNIETSFSDGRIKVISRQHRGLIGSLNEGLDKARGKYIAIMHADDIAYPKRLEKQALFMELNPETGIVGSEYELIDEDNQIIGYCARPANDIEIRWFSLLGNPLGHPTIMMRRKVLIENNLNYSDMFDIVEDYELWSRLLNYTRSANLPEPLLQHRVHQTSRSEIYKSEQFQQAGMIALRIIKEQIPNFNITLEEIIQLRNLFIDIKENSSALSNQQIELDEKYLDLLDAFSDIYRDDPGLKTLRQKEIIKVIDNFHLFSFRPGYLHLLNRLITMDFSSPKLFLMNKLTINKFNYKIKSMMKLPG